MARELTGIDGILRTDCSSSVPKQFLLIVSIVEHVIHETVDHVGPPELANNSLKETCARALNKRPPNEGGQPQEICYNV